MRARLPLVTLYTALAAFSVQANEPVSAPADTAPLVRSEVIELTHQPRPVRTSGQIVARSEQRMAFKIGGPLAQILVREGDTVREGQLLAALDLEEIDAQVAQARARTEEARRQLARLQSLQERQLISAQQVESAETAHRLAQEDLRMAEFNRKHGEIRAPANGRVLRRHVEPNEILTPYQPVLSVALDQDGWALRAGLSDREIVRVNTGDRAEIEFDAYPGQLFTGAISDITPMANPLTGTFDVEIRLQPSAHRLFAGFTGRVRILPSRAEPVALVPVDALIWADRNEGRLYRITDTGELSATSVRLGALAGDRVEIHGGVQPGWRIVTQGTERLREGMAVRLNPAPL